VTDAPGARASRWWKGRRKPDEEIVDDADAVEVVDLRASALEEWERSADLVEYSSDLKDSCADRRPEDGDSDHVSAMKPQISVQPRGGDGQWAAQEIGAERAEKLYDQKGDAVAHALAQAKQIGADLVIEDDEGMIERWEGHDPRPHD